MRKGFTVVELLIVVMIVGILAMAGIPRMKGTIERRNVNAARERVEAMIGTARAAAIHKGRQALFFTSGTQISVWTKNPTTGSWEIQTPWQNLATLVPGVTLHFGGAAWSYVWYDKRGLTWAKPSGTTVFRVTGPSAVTDSVCVTRMGQILPRNCLS